MERRRFLVTAATGTVLAAGCVSRGPGAGPNDEATTAGTRIDDGPTPVRTDDRSSSATTTDEKRPATTADRTRTANGTQRGNGESEVQRRVSLSSVDEVPDEHRLSIDVKLLESTVTAAHTARLHVTTTNEGPKRKISIQEDDCSLFNRTGGRSENEGLWLHPPDSTEYIDRTGDRWTRDRNPKTPVAIPMYGCLAQPYSEGQSIMNEYLVWDYYRTEGYMAPGTYRFAEPVRVYGSDGDVSHTTEPAVEFAWGFSLVVEKP